MEQVVRDQGLDLTSSSGRLRLVTQMPYEWTHVGMGSLKEIGRVLGVWVDDVATTHDQLIQTVVRAWAYQKTLVDVPPFQVGDAVRTDGDVVWSSMSNEVTVETAPNEAGIVTVRQVAVSTARIPASRLRKVP
jgi:hypothetical protein